jgi:dTDP-4-dehydrorhamnose reductase
VKYLVLGSGGQLGRDLCALLPDAVAATRQDADLSRPGEVRAALERIRPDVVVNCAAYNFVDRAEDEPTAAFAVNAWGVRELAAACRDLSCVLVHFSSDYIFGLDETRQTPYAEEDAPGPLSVYGLSKLAGEYFVRALCPRHFVVRTCGLYGIWGSGGKGGNFVETMLRLAGQGKPLRVVGDQVCTPTSTADLAAALMALLATKAHGLYHLTSGGQCSWYEFAHTIFELVGVRADLTAITSAEYGAKARRPRYSVLDNGKWRRLGQPSLRAWPEALEDYLRRRPPGRP